MFEDLREIVEIKSVDAPASRADAPFGQGLRNALDWFLNKASSYGLKVGEGDRILRIRRLRPIRTLRSSAYYVTST